MFPDSPSGRARKARWLVASGAFTWLLVTGSASAGDKAVAEALFNEAQALFARGEIVAACQKFAASQAQEASSGTALNLARCYETLGKTASAWAQYEEAGRIANVQGRQDRVEEARLRANEIKPKVSKLTVRVEGPVPGLRVVRSGVELPSAAWNTALPSDPGAIAIVAEAPGHQSLQLEVRLGPDGDAQTVTVPPLKPLPRPPAAAAPKAPENPTRAASSANTASSASRVPAYIVGGAGVGLIVAGSAFGFWSNAVYEDAKRACGDKTSNCSPDAMSLRRDAELWANVSNVGFGLGVAALGVGTYLFLSSPRAGEAPIRPSAWVGREGGGAVLRGRF